MNWGSGQEPIIGRNEFLSQPSQEACGPGKPALTRVSGKGKKMGLAMKRIWIQASRSRMDLDKGSSAASFVVFAGTLVISDTLCEPLVGM